MASVSLLNGKVGRALKVVEILNKCKSIKNLVKNDRCWLETYNNGREQGFILQVCGVGAEYINYKFTFSENRNSDAMVLYQSDRNIHNITETITDQEYDARQFFSGENAEEDVAFQIIQTIRMLTSLGLVNVGK